MSLMNNLAAMLLAALVVSAVTAGARGVAPSGLPPLVNSAHRVLDQPVLRTSVSSEKSITLDLEWHSRWRGGPVEIRGSLFLEHGHHPAGCVVSCRVDPSILAETGRWSIDIPIDPADPAMVLLREADPGDLRVRFSPRP